MKIAGSSKEPAIGKREASGYFCAANPVTT